MGFDLWERRLRVPQYKNWERFIEETRPKLSAQGNTVDSSSRAHDSRMFRGRLLKTLHIASQQYFHFAFINTYIWKKKTSFSRRPGLDIKKIATMLPFCLYNCIGERKQGWTVNFCCSGFGKVVTALIITKLIVMNTFFNRCWLHRERKDLGQAEITFVT